MSWAEVYAINKNRKRSLNEQIRDMKYNPIRVITTTGTYSPEKTGLYKVICVGKGGDGYYNDSSNNYSASGGASGGVAIKTIRLTKETSYNVTVSTTASFSNELTATSGGSSSGGGTGGTATGGDYNFNGISGTTTQDAHTPVKGGSISVAISDLITTGTSEAVFDIDNNDEPHVFNVFYGDSLLGYGGGGGAVVYNISASAIHMVGKKSSGLPAAVLIIPLEMEE